MKTNQILLMSVRSKASAAQKIFTGGEIFEPLLRQHRFVVLPKTACESVEKRAQNGTILTRINQQC